MALVRVYCGLAATEPTQKLTVGSQQLSATIVDDAGRVLDSCDIGDDAYGYAYLSALLAERAAGPYSVVIATDSDRRLVPRLLMTAGWALAVVDEGSVSDYAERFADPLRDRVGVTDTGRRAFGLALALQAGALSATLQPTPDELADLKPVLAALSALATGRHSAAVALREVLRELYPAALRALPDPADPVALAVLHAVPEASMLGGRGRNTVTPDEVAAQVADAGGDGPAAAAAVNALRAALAETPRRNGIGRSLTNTVADTVRRTVATVQTYDAASSALVAALAERVVAAGARPSEPAASERSPRQAERTQIPAPRRSQAPDPLSDDLNRSQAADLLSPVSPAPEAADRRESGRPVSAPPPPPGITPIRQQSTTESGSGSSQVPSPRPSRETAPRGSRQAWATQPPADDDWALPASPASPAPWRSEPSWGSESTSWDSEPAAHHSWSGDDSRTGQRSDSPSLRLVEPDPVEEPRNGHRVSDQFDQPSLRLVEPTSGPGGSAGDPGVPRSVPPVSADGDDNLLIFEQIRSAWFNQDKEADWNSEVDEGWMAAEQAAQPTVGERTTAGLPRRVPHANLIPGAPPSRERRPLRVVRDPASIAAHTSGYFNGWRRGQEVGGYPLGNRPARRAAGAWEFHRDEDRVSG